MILSAAALFAASAGHASAAIIHVSLSFNLSTASITNETSGGFPGIELEVNASPFKSFTLASGNTLDITANFNPPLTVYGALPPAFQSGEQVMYIDFGSTGSATTSDTATEFANVTGSLVIPVSSSIQCDDCASIADDQSDQPLTTSAFTTTGLDLTVKTITLSSGPVTFDTESLFLSEPAPGSVPEPSSSMAMLSGLALLGFFRWRARAG
jgi:hypothetical protein